MELLRQRRFVARNETIDEDNGQLRFGLLNFGEAFEHGVDDFLDKLGTDDRLQQRALYRYREVTGELSPSTIHRVNRQFIVGTVGFVTGITTGFIIEAFRRSR